MHLPFSADNIILHGPVSFGSPVFSNLNFPDIHLGNFHLKKSSIKDIILLWNIKMD